MVLYHGTQIQNIKQLKPTTTRGNAIIKPVICFTPNPYIALFYIWNRPYKWVAFSENEYRKVIFTEHYENMLFDFYHQLSGSIYQCDGDNYAIKSSQIKGVYISEIAISIEKEMIIWSVYDKVIRQENWGISSFKDIINYLQSIKMKFSSQQSEQLICKYFCLRQMIYPNKN